MNYREYIAEHNSWILEYNTMTFDEKLSSIIKHESVQVRSEDCFDIQPINKQGGLAFVVTLDFMGEQLRYITKPDYDEYNWLYSSDDHGNPAKMTCFYLDLKGSIQK